MKTKVKIAIAVPIVAVVLTVGVVLLVVLRKRACVDCKKWKCESGECVQGAGGIWDSRAQCSCGVCRDGACVAAESGGAYPSVSACEADGAAVCRDDTLGWACHPDAGNAERCVQTPGGEFASLEECSCWTCTGTPPGPASLCVFDAGGGEYDTHQECFEDDTTKCGWKYMCQS
jgi:hypothetical protein